MDRVDGDIEVKVARPRGFFARLGASIKGAIEKRKEGIESPIYDIAVFLIALLVSRCHIVFGSHPVAIGLIAVMPSRVWVAVLGASLGSLTLGKAGVVYAMVAVIVAFLRLIISGTDRSHGGEEIQIFHEGILLRMSSAVIGGFIISLYEVLLNGFSLTNVLFGVSMVVLPAVITFALSGLFSAGITAGSVFRGTSEVFSLKRRDDKEKFAVIFFECSALLLIFLVSLSLKEYELLGISAGYIFSGLATIFTARRFGAIRGGAVGFVSSVGLSSVYSVAYLLVGLTVGALSSLGIVWCAVAGGVALSLWGAYAGGLSGLLSVFPEYAIAASIAVPLFKRTKLERTREELEGAETLAEDMVGTMALSYKSKFTGALDSLEDSFGSLAVLCRKTRETSETVTEEESYRLSLECIHRYFDTENPHIPGRDEARATFLSAADKVSTILYKNKKISAQDFATPTHLSQMATALADSINRAAAILAEEKFKDKMKDTSPEDFEHIAKLINEARLGDESEKTLNEALTIAARNMLADMSITGSAVQIFGKRVPYVIIATEDESGSVITSPKIKGELEVICGVRLGTPEYYRRGKMALFECTAVPSRSVISYSVGSPMDGSLMSGDTSHSFETKEGRHFSLISDGMGTGKTARDASAFVSEFLTRALLFGAGCESALRLLSNMIKRRGGGTTVTVDLFSLDLITGEAMFYKCGAAPSYIKRGSSLFRIRSRTSPLGPLGELDAERIRVELEAGDHIIMFSDGISADSDDAPWLIELLAKPMPKGMTTEGYSELILKAARAQNGGKDDMTVRVIRLDDIA